MKGRRGAKRQWTALCIETATLKIGEGQTVLEGSGDRSMQRRGELRKLKGSETLKTKDFTNKD